MNEIKDKVALALHEGLGQKGKTPSTEVYELATMAIEAVCKELERLHGQTGFAEGDEVVKAYIAHEMIQDMRR